MTEYVLNVERREKNPDYSPQSYPRFYNGSEQPMYINQQVLNVVVTQEQFEAIRKAALEQM